MLVLTRIMWSLHLNHRSPRWLYHFQYQPSSRSKKMFHATWQGCHIEQSIQVWRSCKGCVCISGIGNGDWKNEQQKWTHQGQSTILFAFMCRRGWKVSSELLFLSLVSLFLLCISYFISTVIHYGAPSTISNKEEGVAGLVNKRDQFYTGNQWTVQMQKDPKCKRLESSWCSKMLTPYLLPVQETRRRVTMLVPRNKCVMLQ